MKLKMIKRLLDQKTVKISFNESPGEQDFNCDWDVNFSSDEDIFLKGKSEILWSRTRDLFDSPNSYQSFSDFTERTLSSCSWHNDEFDMKSSNKVNASLEAIDTALYETVKSPFLNDTLFQECCDWAEKFPYFRIKGQPITSTGSKMLVPYPTSTANIMHFDLANSSSSLHLEGRRLPIHSASKSKAIHVDNTNDNKVSTCVEEALDNEEKYEEYLALHKSDQSSDNLQVPINDNSKVHCTIRVLQDKVLDKLVSEMWPSVLAFLEKLDDKSTCNSTNDLQLPPINISKEQKKVLCAKRPNTEGSGVINTEFPKLGNILTVCPKILQKRENGFINRVDRPNSEMSINPRMSSKSMKSVYQHSRTIHLNSEFSSVKGAKCETEAEGPSLVLPALEEDFQDSSSVLRGFHIQPERKDTVNKTIHSTGNEYETPSSARENYFLPPIEDKNYLPSNAKLTKNLFTFYGSSVMQERNKYPGSAKYKKPNSRPNTSVSKKVIKSHEVSRQLPINSGLYINAKGINKTSQSLYTESSSESAVDHEIIEEKEKLVTLFPIVTSLMPHEDQNNDIKKGFLHTFLGGRKR